MPDRFWRTDLALHATLPGLKIIEAQDIEIADDRGQLARRIVAPPNFQTYTRDCLNWLYQTACGSTVLDAIVGASNCSIAFSQGNSAGVGNAHASMTQAAYEIAHGGAPGVDSGNALQRCFNAYGARRHALAFRRGRDLDTEFTWLAHVVNRMPRWLLDRAPGDSGGLTSYAQSWRDSINRWAPSLWSSDATEGHFDEDLWLPRFGVSSSGLDVTPTEIQTWMGGTAPARLSPRDLGQLKLATIVALEEFSSRGAGSPSSIRFAIGPSDPLRDQRPPCIALGHELIHAYFSLKGRQPGEEFQHVSTVLFEFKCVGLGPWKDGPISENALRKQWSAVVSHPHNALDLPNQRIPGRRIRY